MKIKKFMAMMIATAALCGGFASCGDDDDDQEPAKDNQNPSKKTDSDTTAAKKPAELIAGTYNGVLTFSVMGTDILDTVAYEFKKIDDSLVSMIIPSVAYGKNVLPQMIVDSISVNGTDKVTASIDKVSGSVKVDTTMKTFTLTNLVISNSGNDVTVSYTEQYGNMPMTMDCKFEGKK